MEAHDGVHEAMVCGLRFASEDTPITDDRQKFDSAQ